MKKLSSLFAVLAVVLALTSAFTSRTFDDNFRLYGLNDDVLTSAVMSQSDAQIQSLNKDFIRDFGASFVDITPSTLVAGWTTQTQEDDITAEEFCPTSSEGYTCLIEVEEDGSSHELSVVDYVAGEYSPF